MTVYIENICEIFILNFIPPYEPMKTLLKTVKLRTIALDFRFVLDFKISVGLAPFAWVALLKLFCVSLL